MTVLLNAAGSGDPKASEEILPLVYAELRKLAQSRIANEPGGGAGYTLQPTALVHEAYLRLVGDPNVSWSSRGHFFGAAAIAMRRILVDRARVKGRIKHGRDFERREFDEATLAADEPDPDTVLALDEALTKLDALGGRSAEVVMLRCFAGLTVPETAAAMGLSERTVKTEWKFACAWLRRELAGESHAADSDEDSP